MWQAFHDSAARLLEKAMLFMNLWKHSSKPHKRSLFEIDEVLSICRASFRENNQRVILVRFLAFLDSLGDLFKNKLFTLLRVPIQDEALTSPKNVANSSN